MSRRSERIKQRCTGNPPAPNASGLATSPNEDVNPPANELEVQEPPTKTAFFKGASRALKRNGKLYLMLDMPMDVVLEICGYLHPQDLLYLARTSKGLRELFMSRRMLLLWKSVLRNLEDLPPCPEGTSEPAYVAFVFDLESCSVCGKENCDDVYAMFMMRLCSRCRKAREIKLEASGRVKAAMDMVKPRQLTKLIPIVRVLRYNIRLYKPEFIEFLATLKKTPVDEREAFLARTEKLLSIRVTAARAIWHYTSTAKSSRQTKAEEWQAAREEAITKRLKEAGYEEELSYMKKRQPGAYQRFRKSSAVDQPRPLTSGIWNTIKDGLIKTMEAIRKERLFEAKKAVLFERLAYVSEYIEDTGATFTDHSLSSLEVVLCVPGIYEFLDREATEFDARKFTEFLHEVVPLYMSTREERVQNALRTTIRRALSIPAAVDPFELAAVTWLSCSRCNNVLPFQQVPKHTSSCSTDSSYYRGPAPPPQELIQDGIPKPIQSVLIDKLPRDRDAPSPPWGGNWQLFQRGVKEGAAVVEACGFDARTATVEDLDRADVRLTCCCSNHFSSEVPVMTWRSAIHHASACTTRSSRGSRFHRADEGAVAAVQI